MMPNEHHAAAQRYLDQLFCWLAGEVLEGMTYATAVIRESLRFRPAVPGVMRRATEDLQVGDYHIPKVGSCDV